MKKKPFFKNINFAYNVIIYSPSQLFLHCKPTEKDMYIMNFPTIDQVKQASQEQLARWSRFLPSPTNEQEEKILALISENFKGWNSDLSKKIGWSN